MIFFVYFQLPTSSLPVVPSPNGPESGCLEVKVVKAAQLGGSQGCVEPYVVLELDEPSQRHQTRAILGNQPRWEDKFSL